MKKKYFYCCLLLFSLLSAANNIITSCEGSSKYGSNIYIDFYAIGRPCTCIALPSFDGELFITSVSGDINYDCGTQIYVKNAKVSYIFRCPISSFAAQILNVNINQSVGVQADYLFSSSPGTFYHCIRLYQNGMNVYVFIHVSNAFSGRFAMSFFIKLHHTYYNYFITSLYVNVDFLYTINFFLHKRLFNILLNS